MSWSRRKFMIAGAVGVGAPPLLAELSNMLPEARADVVPKAIASSVPEPAAEHNRDDRAKCRGCQVCKIMYSNCMTLNDRHCWLEISEARTS